MKKKFIAAAISTLNLIGQQDATFKNMRKWTKQAASQGAELVLFPELNITGYFQHLAARQFAESIPGPSTDKAVELAHEMGVTLACGILEVEEDQFYCSHIIVNGDGLIGKQRKVHTPVQEQPFWDMGNSIEVFDTDVAKIGISICRDSFFDEFTRTLYFMGAEVVLMPFGYYNVPRSRYLKESIHGMSIIKACWTNGYYAVVCNSAGDRQPSDLEPHGSKFPGWAGVIDPWGSVVKFIDSEGNGEAMALAEVDPARIQNRREHANFLARELRPELYRLKF